MYPKWIQRAPHIGAVLVLNEAEEKALMDDWNAQQLAAAQEAKDKADAEAAAAKAEAEIVLKAGKGK